MNPTLDVYTYDLPNSFCSDFVARVFICLPRGIPRVLGADKRRSTNATPGGLDPQLVAHLQPTGVRSE
jgi:hypothetical protein